MGHKERPPRGDRRGRGSRRNPRPRARSGSDPGESLRQRLSIATAPPAVMTSGLPLLTTAPIPQTPLVDQEARAGARRLAARLRIGSAESLVLPTKGPARNTGRGTGAPKEPGWLTLRP